MKEKRKNKSIGKTIATSMSINNNITLAFY
jgi:hypothetical protein